MASKIKIKRSSVAGRTPTISDIDVGELAINTKDQKLYSSNGTAVFQIGASGGGGAVSITTAIVKNLTQNDTVVTNVTSYANSVVDNSMLATKASWTALTSTNTALRTLISDRIQVANVVATYQTKAVERAALANTNAYIGTQATRITLVNTNLLGTNTAIRALDAQKLSVANATTLLAAKATWTGLTGTNTALRTLISDRLQVANASTLYATKSNPTTSGLLAHTGRATISTNLAVSGNATVTGTMTATGVVSGLELTSTLASGDEGGQVNLTKPPNGTLSGGVTIDAYQNKLRIFEQGGSARGVYIDLSTAAAGVGSNLLTNRVVSYTDQNSITINADTTDTATQSYTGAAGTLTINAPTGTLVNGQKLLYRLTTTNAQTLSWNAIFRGSTDLSLPTTSSGSSKTDYLAFIYNSTATKWDLLAKNFGY